MGSVLNDLIRIKTSMQEDDLIKMLDEIPVYGKLSVSEQFKDLEKSEITRERCPMLAAFADGEPYETILAELAANVYLQMEGRVPDVLQAAVMPRTPKQQKQFEILQKGIARVTYLELTQYDHELMADKVAAVFTKKEGRVVTAAIIVKSAGGYEMYHGMYDTKSGAEVYTSGMGPVVVRGGKGVFAMDTYSVLGNNGYRFGTYTKGGVSYGVMIGPDGTLFLMDGDRVAISFEIPHERRNALNMAKKDFGRPETFAGEVLSIIENEV